uniref:Ig-like domain-containing protein n=1 Tax=Sander lucioperca TaxID=283035 RepID=A0A8C9ZUL9_SANLU
CSLECSLIATVKHCYIHAGLTDGSDVTQAPDRLWGEKGDNATIHCSHTKDSTYRQMYWYRQLPGERMKQIPDYGGVPQTKYSAIKENTESGALTVKDLQLEDSAVYFCAQLNNNWLPTHLVSGLGTKCLLLYHSMKVLPPSTKECRNQKDGPRKKTIVCVASGFYPDHVSVKWKIDGIKATSGVATDNAALQEGGYYRITSRLKVSGEDWFTLYKNFTCIVEMSNKKSLCPVCCSVQLENGTTES